MTTPAQLRQLAASRFLSSTKNAWCDKADTELRRAADTIERLERELLTTSAKLTIYRRRVTKRNICNEL